MGLGMKAYYIGAWERHGVEEVDGHLRGNKEDGERFVINYDKGFPSDYAFPTEDEDLFFERREAEEELRERAKELVACLRRRADRIEEDWLPEEADDE